jgi:hypothetical protein
MSPCFPIDAPGFRTPGLGNTRPAGCGSQGGLDHGGPWLEGMSKPMDFRDILGISRCVLWLFYRKPMIFRWFSLIILIFPDGFIIVGVPAVSPRKDEGLVVFNWTFEAETCFLSLCFSCKHIPCNRLKDEWLDRRIERKEFWWPKSRIGSIFQLVKPRLKPMLGYVG